jgi:hypothetical protein
LRTEHKAESIIFVFGLLCGRLRIAKLLNLQDLRFGPHGASFPRRVSYSS